MKLTFIGMTLGFLTAAFFVTTPVGAQKQRPKTGTAVKPPLLVVRNDGKRTEPTALVSDGELVVVSDDPEQEKAFGNGYYRPKSSYPLIFGGAADGAVTVVKSNIGTECGGPSADVTFKSAKAKPAGLVMALASNVKIR